MSRFDATGQGPVDKWTAAPRLTTSPQANHNNRSGQLIWYINRSNQNVLDIQSCTNEWDARFVDLDVFGTDGATEIAKLTDKFCLAYLRSAVAGSLFYRMNIGTVSGIELTDGRRVVIKARPPLQTNPGVPSRRRAPPIRSRRNRCWAAATGGSNTCTAPTDKSWARSTVTPRSCTGRSRWSRRRPTDFRWTGHNRAFAATRRTM